MSHMILQRCMHVTCPLLYVYIPRTSKLFFRPDLTFKRDHGCCCTNISSPDGAYAEYQTTTTRTAATRAHARWLAWSYVRRTSNCINARSIVRSPDYSCDAVASSYNTHLNCCTANAPGRKIYRKIYYISLAIIAQRLPNGASDRACCHASTFFMRTFIKQMANFFARTTFWSHPLVQRLWKTHYCRRAISFVLSKCLNI